jgi:ABC-type Mn2+/Zn2+ transport system ATPase subunit
VAVIGPNGAGKSTLFKLIAGVLIPSSGKILLFGKEGPAEHICIAYLPQRTQVDWNFPVTVADVVMMGRVGKLGWFRQPGQIDWQVVHQSLESVQLNHLAKRQINELSGGQQQRMFIARALAQEAEMILMDEPLNGLDTPSQQIIFEILDSLHNKGVVVLVATHDLDLAAEHFDSIMLLNRRIVGFGNAAEVFTTPHLLEAYGGHLHMINSDGTTLALGDTCCDDEHH